MVQINNLDAIKAIREGTRMSNVDPAPTELGKTAVPVIDMTPDFHRKIQFLTDATATNATSATFLTTPTDRDFYLVGYVLSVVKDVTALSTSTAITGTPFGGSAQAIVRIPTLVTTAERAQISHTLAYPLKMKRGTTITISNSDATANIVGAGTIYGYYDFEI